MSHTFSVTIPKGIDLASGVEQVRDGVEGAGGTYQFDGKNGKFSVKGVTGTFTVAGQVVTISIEKKPFIVSHGFVEKSIRGYFV